MVLPANYQFNDDSGDIMLSCCHDDEIISIGVSRCKVFSVCVGLVFCFNQPPIR